MWTVASTLNRTKNYCFRLLSLIAENNATQNLEYQTNSQPTGNKNELVSTVKKPGSNQGPTDRRDGLRGQSDPWRSVDPWLKWRLSVETG